MKSDDQWVEVEPESDWVFVNPEENEEDDQQESGNKAAADASAAAPTRHVQKEDSDVNGDGNEVQNNQRRETVRERVSHEWGYGFSAHDVSPLEFDRGACKIDADKGPCEDDDKVTHVISYIRVVSEGLCKSSDGDEDRCGRFNVESAYHCSENAHRGGREEEEEEEEEEEDNDDDDDDYEDEDEDENDEYSDALHEGALQHEVNSSLVDAMERYYTNPVRECWQEYICSVQTEIRRELHKTKMASLRGYGPEPRPFINDSTCFNPLFEKMWLPWATNTEYCHDEDMGLLVWDGATGFTQCTLAAKLYMSSTVPTLPVLEYMVNRTPGKKIAHIGSGSSLYWAALLHQLGAANVIVTEENYPVTCTPAGYPHVEQIEEEMFFMLNMAVGQALFFLRPSKRSRDAEPCMAERCLFCFPGDTIFFVGECGKHASNFDMAQWVEEHAIEGWYVEKEMEIPCWPGSHDVFLCITKASMPVDVIS